MRTVYTMRDGVQIAAITVSQFRVVLADTGKRDFDGNCANGGFFGTYHEDGQAFTLPAGHVAADYGANCPYTAKYCLERGKFDGVKFSFDASAWGYQNQFYGKSVSTLMVRGCSAEIRAVKTLPKCDYAIAGVPVIRDGKAVLFTDAKKEGWDASVLYATYHVFLGLKGDGMVYVMGMKTKTGNLLTSGEAFHKFRPMGFTDVIKLDGGGSYYFRFGKATATSGNRRICTVIPLGGNPYPEPTVTVKRWSMLRESVRWVQWELQYHGYSCDIDGKFGADTEAKLKEYQTKNGLTPDGKCGPATRAALRNG